MAFCSQRVTKENDKIDLIVFDLCADLLHASQMSCQQLMNGKIGNFFNQSACSTRRADFIFCKNPSIGDAEILHQFLFCVMCDQCDPHLYLPCNIQMLYIVSACLLEVML